MRAKLFKRAQQQLIDIWLYTEEKWNSAQADKYIDGLNIRLKQITENSHLWKKVRSKKLAGVFFFRYEKRLVFFKRLPSGDLGIISILHEQMDLPRRLLDDINADNS